MKKVAEVLICVTITVWFAGIMVKGSGDFLEMFLPYDAVKLIMMPLIFVYLFLSGFLSLEIIDYFKKDHYGKSKKELDKGSRESRA